MASTAILLTPRAARLPVSVDASFAVAGRATAVTLINVTIYGFMAEASADLRSGQRGVLTLLGEELPAEIRWCDGGRFGAQFVPALRTFTLARILAAYP